MIIEASSGAVNAILGRPQNAEVPKHENFVGLFVGVSPPTGLSNRLAMIANTLDTGHAVRTRPQQMPPPQDTLEPAKKQLYRPCEVDTLKRRTRIRSSLSRVGCQPHTSGRRWQRLFARINRDDAPSFCVKTAQRLAQAANRLPDH